MGAEPRFRLVGGKGGVGKTTCAAAIAVSSAASGARTLLVSTDPSPSLAGVLGAPVGRTPRRVPLARGNLRAVEIDADRTLMKWLQPRSPVLEEIAVRGTWLDREDVSRLLSQALPGIDEIAALLEIGRLARSRQYDLIVVDTAPTGHTLRMLAMPEALSGLAHVFDTMQGKHRAMVAAIRGTWRGDAADALIEEMESEGRAIGELLRDPVRLRTDWVTLPEPMAVEETRDAVAALGGRGMPVRNVIVNRMTPEPPQTCRWCNARRAFERRALVTLGRLLPGVTFSRVASRQTEPRGAAALLEIARELGTPAPIRRMAARPRASRVRANVSGVGSRADLLVDGRNRLLLFGGKGGVGKTTCAAAAALEIAVRHPRTRMLLISTDPAHSLGDVLGEPLADEPRTLSCGPGNLATRELDAEKQFAEVRDRYGRAIDAVFDGLSRGSAFEASHDRRVMRDLIDLAPPGIDELIAITEVTDAIAIQARYDLVIMDTAPSGHALRLLAMPEIVRDWVKVLMSILLKYRLVGGLEDVGRLLVKLSQGLGRLREALGDPDRARFVAVTRPETLPVVETARMLDRLTALGIRVPTVIVNAIGVGTCGNCERVRAAQANALGALERKLRSPSPSLVLARAEMPPPHGAQSLLQWRADWQVRKA